MKIEKYIDQHPPGGIAFLGGWDETNLFSKKGPLALSGAPDSGLYYGDRG